MIAKRLQNGTRKQLLTRAFTPSKLHIYDSVTRTGISGIRATIFGATGHLGHQVGGTLGNIGSEVVYPVRGW